MASVSMAVVGLGGSLLGDRPAGGELDREARFAMACAGRRVRSFVRSAWCLVFGVWCWVLGVGFRVGVVGRSIKQQSRTEPPPHRCRCWLWLQLCKPTPPNKRKTLALTNYVGTLPSNTTSMYSATFRAGGAVTGGQTGNRELEKQPNCTQHS